MQILFCSECNTRKIITVYERVFHEKYKCDPCLLASINAKRMARIADGDFADPGPCPDMKTAVLEDCVDWMHRKVDHMTKKFTDEIFKKPDENDCLVPYPAASSISKEKREEIASRLNSELQDMEIEMTVTKNWRIH